MSSVFEISNKEIQCDVIMNGVDEKSLSNEQKMLAPDLEKIVNDIATKEGLNNYILEIKHLCPDGSNYIGLLTEVTIKDGIKELNLFIKSTLPRGDNMSFLTISDLYLTESFVYGDLSKIFDKIQNEVNLPIEERYIFTKCYSAVNAKYIIMENMAKKGFTTFNRFDLIPLDAAEKCIKRLAQFHAMSFVIEKKYPKYFNDRLRPREYPIMFNDDWKDFIDNSIKVCLTYFDGELRRKLERLTPNIYKRIKYHLSDRKTVLCMCHGDYRINNVLVKFEGDKVTEAVPVDFQIVHYGSPILDFIYFVYGCTDAAFRRKHLEDLKNIYVNTMDKFLKHFAIDIEDVFPKHEFYRMYNEKQEYALFFSIWYLQIVLIDNDSVPDFSETPLSEIKLSTTNVIVRDRLHDLVNEFVELGFL